MGTTYTARVVEMNHLESNGRSYDLIAVFDGDEEVGSTSIESSDKASDYDAAVRALGFRNVEWEQQSL